MTAREVVAFRLISALRFPSGVGLGFFERGSQSVTLGLQIFQLLMIGVVFVIGLVERREQLVTLYFHSFEVVDFNLMFATRSALSAAVNFWHSSFTASSLLSAVRCFPFASPTATDRLLCARFAASSAALSRSI